MSTRFNNLIFTLIGMTLQTKKNDLELVKEFNRF